MLSRPSNIPSSPALGSPDSIQPLHDCISDLPSPVNFPSIEDDVADAHDEDDSSLQEDSQDEKGEHASELDFLMPRNDFRELFNRFFVLGHQELLMLQANIRQERGLENTPSMLVLRNIDNLQTQALRNQYYKLQTLLFNMSKGSNHTSAI